MRIVDIIEKTKNAIPLSKGEIDIIVKGAADGSVPDYQLSALMMAIYFNDMTDGEIADFTIAMANSGDTVDLTSIDGIKVDKHSTGGVADTTTLIAAPMVAALDIPVAKMSGRGLGHTGGTLDKLESIPGFNINIGVDGIIENVKKCGISIAGQTGDLVPADKKLYALRDVTATVNSVPMIAASIMSKKIASGCDGLVLDVKLGSGSFCKEKDMAYRLAKTMVNLGKSANLKTTAIISDMNQPLGRAIGNGLEVREAVEVLNGSIKESRLKTVAMEIAINMAMIGRDTDDRDAIQKQLEDTISDGSALIKLKEMIINQNGDAIVLTNTDSLVDAKHVYKVLSHRTGNVVLMDCEGLGRAAAILGAGREKKSDTIDYSVGYEMEVELGSRIEKDGVLATFYANDVEKARAAEALFRDSIEIEESDYNSSPLIIDIIR